MKRPRKPKPPPLGINGLAPHDQRKLMEIVTRIERLQSERSAISDAIADVFAEAREWNFHLPTIRRALRDRALPAPRTTRRSKGGDHVSAESTGAATPVAPAAAPVPDPELAGKTIDDTRALRAEIEGETT